jgi:rfaE bifunctional protein kinase chain/domain
VKALLDLFPSVSVAVIGDLMLDCYLYGDVSRLSPEAPVPVMRALSERVVAGGAANVAANLAALGLQVHLVGLCGQDEAREQLVACLAAIGRVDCTRLVAVPNRRTTKKLRIIGRSSRSCASTTRTSPRATPCSRTSASGPRSGRSTRPTWWSCPTTTKACARTGSWRR